MAVRSSPQACSRHWSSVPRLSLAFRIVSSGETGGQPGEARPPTSSLRPGVTESLLPSANTPLPITAPHLSPPLLPSLFTTTTTSRTAHKRVSSHPRPHRRCPCLLFAHHHHPITSFPSAAHQLCRSTTHTPSLGPRPCPGSPPWHPGTSPSSQSRLHPTSSSPRTSSLRGSTVSTSASGFKEDLVSPHCSCNG